MPLPEDPKAPWPPEAWSPIARDIEEWAAWYSGSPGKLQSFYAGANQPSQKPNTGFLSRFWSRQQADPQQLRQRIHVPLCSDIASTAADMLFGEAPTLTIPEAHTVSAAADAIATEARLQEMLDDTNMISLMLEGAEIASGLGGVYLRPVWDPTFVDHPLLTVIHADRAVPFFRFGQLAEVVFWSQLCTEGEKVWRHLELYTSDGWIQHGLYRGNARSIGVKMPLMDQPETAAIAPLVDMEGRIKVPGIDRLAVRYVPNTLPNRTHRGVPSGRSDTSGTESLMDALDEAMTSWMRDVRLAKGRVIVPAQYLERHGRGGGQSFDMDAEVFSPLEMDPGSMEKAGITLNQFAIRTQEHLDTCMELIRRVVASAAYSAATFEAGPAGTMATATEIRARESRSVRTNTRKQRYWARAVQDVAEMLLILDREVFNSQVVPMKPRLDFADGLIDDPAALATTVEILKRAQAASIETRVRWAQPELDEAEVAAEVERITQQEGLAVPDPTGGLV